MRWPFSRKSLADPDEVLLALLGGGAAPNDAGITITTDSALRVPAVQAAVRLISEAAASLSVKVVAIDAAGVETDAPDHDVAKLLQQPNDWSDKFTFIRSLMVDALCRDVGGLAYVSWLNGKPVEIIKYRPSVISANLSADTGEPTYMIGALQQSPQNIIHVRNTFDRAPLSLAAQAIATATVMAKHAARLFGKGARPGGLIETPKTLGEKGALSMLRGWALSMEGSDNAGKTGVLWDGATFKQMQLNSVDAQFQQLWQFVVVEIARAFGIPVSMLNDLSRATWSNSEEMGKQFLVLTLEPWLQGLEGTLRRALFLPEDRLKYAVRFDRDDLSRVDLTALATAISSLTASRTINPNEGRKWLGMPPRTGGEEFANPNTGSSQPGNIGAGGDSKVPTPEPDNAA